MDRRLWQSATRGDFSMLRKLVDQDPEIMEQRVPVSQNTVLHLSARFGHLEFAKGVVSICPDMVSLENADLETALHVACREGHLEIAQLLLETDPWLAYGINCREETVLIATCVRGNAHVVEHLMSFPDLLMLEVDLPTTSLHLAASTGNTEIAKLILEARPDFAGKKNLEGCTPLHQACSKGHLEIVRELVRLDSDLCLVQDNEGRIPLHCAAARGRINIIHEILSVNRDSAESTTHNGETILHLAVKNSQFEVVKHLTEFLDTSKLLNKQDNEGNTVLHLATAGKLTTMVVYLLRIGVEVNALNRKGYTALDVVEADASNSGALAIVPALMEAGAKRCDQLSPEFMEIQQVPGSTPRRSAGGEIQMTAMSRPDRTPNNRRSSQCSPRRHHHHRRHRSSRANKLELQNEGLRNARKTVTIVAVLIATVTFAAGINPPGGFNQQTGKALRGDTAAFKVFLVCNIVALFLSVGVVNVLVSIIPFTRSTMMKLLSGTHKAMWLSTLFMTAAYVAAIWTIMPNNKGSRRSSVESAVLAGGFSVVVFLGLGAMLARHWYNKYSWRRRKNMDESPHSSVVSRIDDLKGKIHKDISSNSDVDSSDHGYHLY